MYSYKLAFALKPKGIVVSLVEPVLVASKPGVESNPMAKPVEEEVGKLVKVNDTWLEVVGVVEVVDTGRLFRILLMQMPTRSCVRCVTMRHWFS